VHKGNKSQAGASAAGKVVVPAQEEQREVAHGL
jgi:hypothetical protein